MNAHNTVLQAIERGTIAARDMARLDAWQKDEALSALAATLRRHRASILDAAASDNSGKTDAPWSLDADAVDRLADTAEHLLRLADPIGQVIPLDSNADDPAAKGWSAARLRMPMGLVAVVTEAAPGYALQCLMACIKCGNACLLRSGPRALHTLAALDAAIGEALKAVNLPRPAFQLLSDTGPEALTALLAESDRLPLALAWGNGETFAATLRKSQIPILWPGTGTPILYIHRSATLEQVEHLLQTPVAAHLRWLIDAEVLPKVAPSIIDIAERSTFTLTGDSGWRATVGQTEPVTHPTQPTISIETADGLDMALDLINREGRGQPLVLAIGDYDAQSQLLREAESGLIHINTLPLNDLYTLFDPAAEDPVIGYNAQRRFVFGPVRLSDLTLHKTIHRAF